MKKLLYTLIIIAASFAGCKSNEPNKPNDKGKLDPNAMILLRGETVPQLRNMIYGLTPLEVV